MAKPIRKELLCHTVTYYRYSDDAGGGFGGEEYMDPEQISNVRIEEVVTKGSNGVGDTLQSKTIMFVDRVHTPYELSLFYLNSKVEFHQKEFYIKDIKYLYDRTQLHHLEIELA
ncbi:putative minor capsid protein [Bacillus paranthracis]|uniref:putative minor capsid protein n=1 Tax=Bacillus paranthracis TaxID=2026186 RepID=UPI003D65D7A4